MAVKKSELYSTLWKCCDELRGGMDASQYKDYVLVILFVKYISDKKRNDEGFDIDIPKGCYFEDFVALKGNPNIGEEMNKKMAALAEEKVGVYMLALFYREFCESPVKLLHREFLFVEFFGSFFPKQDMMFNSILTVKGVIGFCAVATQGIIVFFADKPF